MRCTSCLENGNFRSKFSVNMKNIQPCIYPKERKLAPYKSLYKYGEMFEHFN